jgi:NAD(P)-dependent dehydrogenase (short-subunit alcohol dehydrogenase family)
MCRAFAPVLAANGGGAIVNMLSVVSFYTNPLDPSYSASKAAELSMTNGIRIELSHMPTLVVAVHAGFIDTDMTQGLDVPKISPESVARQAFDAVEADQIEVLADERTRFVKASLARDHELIYPPLQDLRDSGAQGQPARLAQGIIDHAAPAASARSPSLRARAPRRRWPRKVLAGQQLDRRETSHPTSAASA